jgi:ParB family chromosome partitioning protein
MDEGNKAVKIIEKYPREFKELDINKLCENDWNPNTQNELVYKSIKGSIEKHGLLMFPVVRDYVGQYQIIDGEHKWKACKELGYTTIKALVLGDSEHEVSDDDAMALTELLNTRGEDDPIKQAKLIRELQKQNPSQLSLFPYTEKELENKVKLIDFDFSKYDKQEVVEVKRERTLAFALSNAEYDLCRHALSLTKKPQTEGLMVIIKEYLQLREDISKWNGEREEPKAEEGVKE